MLQIKSLAGQTYFVEMTKDMTVGDLYKSLAEKMKEPEENLKIVCMGRLLDNPSFLLEEDLQVHHTTCMYVVVKKDSKSLIT